MAQPANIKQVGDLIVWTIPAQNNGTANSNNVSVQVNITPGLQYISHNAPPGTSFNTTTGVWTIGTLLVGPANKKELKIVSSVVDLALAPYELTATITGTNVDPVSGNNIFTDTVGISECDPVAGAIDDPNACLCGNVAHNDTPCSYGTTSWVLDEDSVENGEITYWNPNTGEYTATFDDPSEPITFEYTIWCNIGEGPVEVSGPATVTIQPILIDSIQGPQGDQGDEGPQGTQGATGAQGVQGVTGSQGPQGTQGVQGPQGPADGPQGPQGTQGATGSMGNQGSQGTQGVPGPQGSQGSQGNTGPQGNQGPQGTTGTQGAAGSQGSQGNQGPQGSQGNQGVAGDCSDCCPPWLSVVFDRTDFLLFKEGTGAKEHKWQLWNGVSWDNVQNNGDTYTAPIITQGNNIVRVQLVDDCDRVFSNVESDSQLL